MVGTVLLVITVLSDKAVTATLDDRLSVLSAGIETGTGDPSQALATPDDAIDDSTWLYAADGSQLDGPRVAERVQETADSLAGVDRRTRVERRDRVYLAAPVAVRGPGAGRGVLVVSDQPAALRADPRPGRRRPGPGRAAGHRRRHRDRGLDRPPDAEPGRGHGRAGRRLERARAGRAVRGRGRAGRDRPPGAHPQRAAGPGRRRAAQRAAPHRRAGPRAAHTADRDPRGVRARADGPPGRGHRGSAAPRRGLGRPDELDDRGAARHRPRARSGGHGDQRVPRSSPPPWRSVRPATWP